MQDIILKGDCLTVLKEMESESVDCCITSPPYFGLRDYGADDQIGLEDTPEEYISRLAAVFDEVRRVLKEDGTLWLNIGDSYAGSWKGAAQDPENAARYKQGTNTGSLNISKITSYYDSEIKPKDLIGIPWMVAFELRRRGWALRQDIIWQKTNPMPESVKDRCTKSHEYIFLMAKGKHYYFDHSAMQEPSVCTKEQARVRKGRYGGNKNTATPDKFNRTKSGKAYNYTGYRNKRDVWAVSTKPFKGAHFATFPPDLIKPCVEAGCKPGGIIIDPFFGSGTVGVVAVETDRHYIGIDINGEYIALAEDRIRKAKKKIEQENAQMKLDL